MNRLKTEVSEKDNNIRLDIFVSGQWELSRSRAQSLIRSGHVWVNQAPCKPSYILNSGDTVEVEIPAPVAVEAKPQDIQLDIIYEDDHLIVVNKKRGMVVHPSPGHADGTLVNALLYHCKNLSGIGGEIRPGIIHRIDKDTTGLIVVAKDDVSHLSLSEQIKSKAANREYKALVEGIIKDDSGEIDAPIGRHPVERKKMTVTEKGKAAQTYYQVEKRYKNHTLLYVKLRTGRTHQIRVHMAYIKHPVVGDPVYGYKKQKFNLEGQMLHAARLEFIHPVTKKTMVFMAPMPDDFTSLLTKLDI